MFLNIIGNPLFNLLPKKEKYSFDHHFLAMIKK